MAKLTKSTVFKSQVRKTETPMEKTSRIVRQMVDDEAELRNIKNNRLRKARLEREANTPVDVKPATVKKSRAKTTAKR